MKKLLAIILTICCLLSLAACTGTETPSASPSVSQTAESPANSTEPETSPPEASPETTPEAAPEASPEASPDTGRTTFTVGFDASFPPYGYMDDNGNYVGFDLDLAAEVCNRNGWELVLRPIDWAAKDNELESGAIDCIWNGFTMSEARLNLYEWSNPYVDNSQVFVVRAGSGINSKADLKGKVVDVQAASSAAEALYSDDEKDFLAGLGQVIEVADYNTAFMDLESGAVDAVAMDVGVAKFQIEGREDQFVILDEALMSEVYAVGFLLGNTQLRDTVQATMNDMLSDGTFEAIAATWGLEDSIIN